ncbi:MAG: hypothetical protein ACI9XB_001589, partial [Gammaproteobacteria bacterium]
MKLNLQILKKRNVLHFVLRLSLCLLGFLIPNTTVYSQCSITADAGPDQTLCSDQSSTTLNGSFTGNPLNFFWTPVTGLDDPTSLTPTVTVTGTISYTLNVQEADNTNLFVNGDFESGNTNFTSDYNYVDPANPFGLITPGSYTIITSPELVLNNAPPCDDHTFGDGTGEQMVINGDGGVEDIWCQTVTVTPNTEYDLGAWMTNYNPLSTPSVQFSIDGVLIGSLYGNSQPCSWQSFGTSFNSGSSSSIEICLTNQFSGSGLIFNDFGLDDFSLTTICTETDEMTITVLDPQVMIDAPGEIDCNATNGCILLNATPSNISGTVSYDWVASNGGIITSGETTATPEVCVVGDYTLIMTELFDGASCETAPLTVSVTDNQASPPEPTVMGLTILCHEEVASYTFDLDPSYTIVDWIAPPGATILSGQGQSTVDIEFTSLISGDVCVTVENNCGLLSINCLYVEVTGDPELPEISGPQSLCASDEVTNYILENLDFDSWVGSWQVPTDAIILSGQGSDLIEVDWSNSEGGDVCVEVINTCGQSQTCIYIVVFPISDTLFINNFTCDPNQAGMNTQNLFDYNGCDSIVVSTIGLLLSDTTYVPEMSCDPTEVGVEETLLQNTEGCDSLVITTT